MLYKKKTFVALWDNKITQCVSLNLNVYILLPYMAKYVRMMNEKGLINIIIDILKQANFKEKLNLMSQSTFSLINRDFEKILKTILDVEIMPFTHIENAILESNVNIGPFSRIRPGSFLSRGSKVGNFVEIKKSKVGKNSKINHLSYIGDSFIGKNVNIGAGTITCNYDGKRKNKTKISDGAFIGSNTSLIAPVKIGKNAIVGAGSSITKNVKNNSLALTRSNQTEIKNYRKK